MQAGLRERAEALALDGLSGFGQNLGITVSHSYGAG